MPNNELKKAAFEYLALGFSVIPLDGKRPLIEWKIYQERQPTKEEVESWFKQEINGIGIVTGKISGIAVMDFDNLNALLEYQQQYGMPDTPSVRTGKGWHYYFEYPKTGVKNATSIFPGVDIRGEGGFVVAPPSLHVSGVQYAWINDLKTKLAPFPSLVQEHSKNKPDMSEVIKGVGEGRRDDSAVSVAGMILYRFPEEQWNSTGWDLYSLWNKGNHPPLDEIQLRKCWKSVLQREKRRRDANMPKIEPIPSLISHSDFLNTEIPPFKWIIDKILPYSGITAFSAPPGHFKTWFALYLALNIARGGALWNKYPIEQMPVLFVNEENYRGIIHDRLRMFKAENELPIYYLHNIGVKLNELRSEELMELCKEKGIKFIIFDSLIRIHGFDENSASDMRKVFESFKIFTNEEISVMFTHHHRKTSSILPNAKANLESMRGSSDIGAMVDTHLFLDVKDNIITLNQGKQRIGILLPPIKFKFVNKEDGSVDFEYIDSLAGEMIKESEGRQMVLDIIKKHKDRGITRLEIVTLLKEKISPRSVQNHLETLREMDEIYPEGERPKRFFPTSEENSVLL